MPSRDAGPVILAGDVGGTKTALALFERRAPDLTLVREAALPGREFATLESAVARFLSGGPPRPIAAASFSIAVPVVDGRGMTTNLPWTIDEKTLEESIPAGRVRFPNDLEATGHGLAALPPGSLPTLQPGKPRPGNAALRCWCPSRGSDFLQFTGSRGMGNDAVLRVPGQHRTGGHRRADR